MTASVNRDSQIYEVAEFPAISCEILATSSGIHRISNLQPSSSFVCSLNTGYFQEEILGWLHRYAAGKPPAPKDLPWDCDALTAFQWAVLEEMVRIPFGETASYQEVAQRMGCPQGARAIGNACNKNPLPLLIPCHRVIASDGGLGGFGFGGEVKMRLLDFEQSIAS